MLAGRRIPWIASESGSVAQAAAHHKHAAVVLMPGRPLRPALSPTQAMQLLHLPCAVQTFAIPGTIFLSLLAGGLWGVWRGSLLVAGRPRRVQQTAGAVSLPFGHCCYSWTAGCSFFTRLQPAPPDPHPLPAVVSTLGSCCCYCMSWAVGQPLAHALWPDRLDRYAAEVAGVLRCVVLHYTPASQA